GAPPTAAAAPPAPRPLHAPVQLADRLHHVLELAQVGTVEGERVVGATVVAGATVRLADVHAVSAQRLAHGRQDPWLVRRGHADLHRAVDLRLAVPGDLDAPLGIRVEGFGTFAPVHRDAASPGDEPDDRVPGQRVTTAGVAHEDVVDPGDLEPRRRLPGDPPDDRLQRAGLERA